MRHALTKNGVKPRQGAGPMLAPLVDRTPVVLAAARAYGQTMLTKSRRSPLQASVALQVLLLSVAACGGAPVDDGGTTGADMMTSSTNPGSSATSDHQPREPGSTSSTTGSTSTTASSSVDTAPQDSDSATSSTGATDSGTLDPGSSSGDSSSTGLECKPGSQYCECFNGECFGDLICGEGDVCFEPDECQGVVGTEHCTCSKGSCFDPLQCWERECVDGCTDAPLTDDEHCGGICGNSCGFGTVAGESLGGCEDGACATFPSMCVEIGAEDVSCADVCATQGAVCGQNCGDGWGAVRFYNATCFGEPGSTTGSGGGGCASIGASPAGPQGEFLSAQCCCG